MSSVVEDGPLSLRISTASRHDAVRRRTSEIEHPYQSTSILLDSRSMTDDARASSRPTRRPRASSSSKARLRPRTLDEYIGQREVKANLVDPPPGGEGQGRGGGPRPALRPARPRQDDARDDHRPRARRERPLHERPGDRAGGGPRRDPHGPRRARRPVHRRDPSPQPGGRGDPLPGDGGLRARRDDRQGAQRPEPAAEPQAVHGRRRHDAGGPDQRPAARPVRGDLPPRLLRRRTS